MTSQPPQSERSPQLSALHIDTLSRALGPVREEWRAKDGLSVELEGASAVVTFSIAESDIATLRAIDRLVRAVVRGNRRALTKIAEPPEPEQILLIARQALDPVRRDDFRDGKYEVHFSGTAVRYDISAWDARVLRRYHRLMQRLYTEGRNSEVIDSLVARRSRPPF